MDEVQGIKRDTESEGKILVRNLPNNLYIIRPDGGED